MTAGKSPESRTHSGKAEEREILKHLKLGKHHAEQALVVFRREGRGPSSWPSIERAAVSVVKSFGGIDWRHGNQRDFKLVQHHAEQIVVGIRKKDAEYIGKHIESCKKRLALCIQAFSDTIVDDTHINSSGQRVVDREERKRESQRRERKKEGLEGLHLPGIRPGSLFRPARPQVEHVLLALLEPTFAKVPIRGTELRALWMAETHEDLPNEKTFYAALDRLADGGCLSKRQAAEGDTREREFSITEKGIAELNLSREQYLRLAMFAPKKGS